MTTYSLGRIAEMLKPLPSSVITDSKLPISHLLTDSRSLLFPESTLFFAISSSRADGHRFIPSLYGSGVRAFVVSVMPVETNDMPDASFIIVDNPLEALQRLASAHRSRFTEMPVIAVTGSQGKTTVKEMLYSLLSQDHAICRSPRSFNSRIGVPLSLWELDSSDDMSVIEAGVSKSGEMSALADMIRPTIGIFTGIGDEHSEGFDSREEKERQKMSLFRGCHSLVVNTDLYSRFIPSGIDETVGFSRSDSGARLRIVSQIVNPVLSSTTVSYSWRQGDVESVTLPMVDNDDVEDAICCLALMLHLGYAHSEIARRMAALTTVDTRLNVMEGIGDSLLVLDFFTPDLSSLPTALDFISRRRTGSRPTTVILSDLASDARDKPTGVLYEEAARLFSLKGIDNIVGIGSEIMRHSAAFAGWGNDARFFPSVDAFVSSVDPGVFHNRLVLVKGTAADGFDHVADHLEARQHETVLEVNLDAVADNFNWFRSHLRPETGIICMVKASGYGAGDIEIAKTLQTRGAAYVAVAVVDEGVKLREAGITMPVMVMNPKVANYRSMFANRLEPEIYSFDLLHDILSAARRLDIRDYPVHIKIDTGMHRLGFRIEDLEELGRLLHAPENAGLLCPASVFSHLAVADCPAEDDYTLSQFEYFDKATGRLFELLPEYDIKRHILNSTGIVRFPDRQFDYVRLGIGLYGVETMDDGSQDGLRPVSALYTSVIAVHEWPDGTTVGYGRYGRLDRPSRIATIPVGYADGIDRHLGRGAMSVWIRGHRCPTVGNICMDACMVDVTEVPECVPGDRVEIFGPHVPASELASILGTIPYEILTSVSDRVKRVYYRE